LKEANWIDSLFHPAQSPDLNPIEAVWNILKQRVRQRIWNSIEELKAILQEEWSKITMQEVRARIQDMPRRCKLLVETGGAPIKSAQWWYIV
jgi:transposase